MRKKILLVDLCHTLYLSNTTFDFLDYLAINGYQKFERVRRLRNSRLVKYTNAVVYKMLGYDLLRIYGVSMLKGFNRNELLSLSCKFLNQTESVNEVIDYIEQVKNDYYCIKIVSASLDFLAEAACYQFDFDGYYSTKLSYSNGVCDGLITLDLLHNKVDVVSQYNVKYDVTFISDNYSDAPVIPEVEKFIAVFSENDKKSRNFWNKREVDFVIEHK